MKTKTIEEEFIKIMRTGYRKNNELRKVTIEPNYLNYPEGSVLVSFGDTKVICAATVEEKAPLFIRGTGKGWVHAEYSMLPRATQKRKMREAARGKQSGRTMEIQRLIARTLRSTVDLEKMGEYAITIDCDVIQADGGTRTASVTGAFVALKLAIHFLLKKGSIKENPIKKSLAAVSVGITPSGEALLDLDYAEDSNAVVDMNLVMTSDGEFAEIQGTGEEATFSKKQLEELLSIGEKGVTELFSIQEAAVEHVLALEENQLINDAESLVIDEVVIATRNRGKAKEFEALFAQKGINIKTLLDYPDIPDVEETGTTFEENALLKAETIAKTLNTVVLADDSGLKIDALGGKPGVYSARYAGEMKSDAANNAKVLHELTDVPFKERTAQFHCTLALAYPGKESLVINGEIPGRILSIPKGNNGFGYDPLFYVEEKDATLAEIPEKEKNKISHRAKALAHLETKWDEWIK